MPLLEHDRVRLRFNTSRTGKLVRLGPQQSVVHLDNGLGDRIFVNDQLVPEAPKGREWMSGKRLEHWETLPRDELKRRVAAEIKRNDLSPEEQQLLEAARDRLLDWKEPRTKESAMDDTETTNADAPPAPAPEKEEETKVARKSTAKRKAKPAGKKAPTKKAAANSGNGRGRGPSIDPDAKVFKTNKENPFREGSGAYKRVELVLKASGKTAGTIAKLAGIESTTLATCKRLGLIRIES